MTQYMLAVHGSQDAPPPDPEEMQAAFAQVDRFNQELTASGRWVFAGGLMPPTTAKVVTAKDSEVLTTDGPFVETKEQLGGFWIITADSLDEALEWSRKASIACMNPVEVRPFQDEPED